MVKPHKLPQFIRAMIEEAHAQEVKAHHLQQKGVMSLSAAQRFLAGDLNPTASTCAAIAKALGMTITAMKD